MRLAEVKRGTEKVAKVAKESVDKKNGNVGKRGKRGNKGNSKKGSGVSHHPHRFPVSELSDKDRKRIIDAMVEVGKRVVCDCCELADVFDADRDNVLDHMVVILDVAVSRGSFRDFDFKGARSEFKK